MQNLFPSNSGQSEKLFTAVSFIILLVCWTEADKNKLKEESFFVFSYRQYSIQNLLGKNVLRCLYVLIALLFCIKTNCS